MYTCTRLKQRMCFLTSWYESHTPCALNSVYIISPAKSLLNIGLGHTIFILGTLSALVGVNKVTWTRNLHQGSIVNLTLVTSGVSVMHMHVQNLLGNDYSVTNFSYSKVTFLTRNSHFLLETHFLTRNSLFLLETHFPYSKLATQLNQEVCGHLCLLSYSP